jgi:hypothetical protein
LSLNTNMHWTYQGKDIVELPEDCVGFVYLITNTTNNRMYIGKKLAKFKRSKAPLKGRRNRRRYKVESDWQEYYGSSDDLTMDMKRIGAENFTREILFYCKSKSELSYVEAREQFSRKVLETKDYYNGHIRVRVHGKGILKDR